MNSGTALDLVVAFNLGLAGQVHCVDMCDGIIAALNIASAPRAGVTPPRFALAYNAGRILSYAFAGALGLFDRDTGYHVLRYVAGATLVINFPAPRGGEVYRTCVNFL